MDKSIIPDEMIDFITKKAEAYGFFVLEVSSKRGIIEITLDKKGGITLDDCSRMNRDISSWLEDNGDLVGSWTIDVCSPGLDRELKSDKDFIWAQGKNVHVITSEPVEGSIEIVGTMSLDDDDPGNAVIVTDDGRKIRIDRNIIVKARLRLETK